MRALRSGVLVALAIGWAMTSCGPTSPVNTAATAPAAGEAAGTVGARPSGSDDDETRRKIRVITDRTEDHLQPLFNAFASESGIDVEAVFLDEGLVSRLESRPREADLVVTKDVELLTIASERGLLQPFASEAIKAAVPERFRDPSDAYFSDHYRARAIFYAPERVEAAELSSIEALAHPQWRGRVCIRSGYHDYNLSLFSQMMATLGETRTRAFLEGLHDNLARTPIGNDREQVKGVYDGVCDVAVANSYYMGIMLASDEQRPWGEATRVFFPVQDGEGTYVLRSGYALTQATGAVDHATKLMEYVVRDDVQTYSAYLTYQYPVNEAAGWPELLASFGADQAGIEDGVLEIRDVPPADYAPLRDEVIRMLDEIRFDEPR